MTASFDLARSLVPVSAEEVTWDVPDGWQQGRGAFGGLLLATLLDAMQSREPDPARLPRAITGEICGPCLAVSSRIATHVLRRGNNQTNVTSLLRQENEIVAHASLTMATPRRVTDVPPMGMSPPPRPRWEDVNVAPIAPPLGPAFAQHYEFRIVGTPPFTAAKEAEVTGFIRERTALSRLTHAALVGRLDAFYPALFNVSSSPRPMATVSFMAEFLVDPSTLDPATPLFYRARSIAEAGGYVVELRELWHGDSVVALNQQTFAILK